jgi:hypothetical protein
VRGKRPPALTERQQQALAVLDRARKAGYVSVGYAYICKELGVSLRSASITMRSLERRRRVVRTNADGRVCYFTADRR